MHSFKTLFGFFKVVLLPDERSWALTLCFSCLEQSSHTINHPINSIYLKRRVSALLGFATCLEDHQTKGRQTEPGWESCGQLGRCIHCPCDIKKWPQLSVKADQSKEVKDGFLEFLGTGLTGYTTHHRCYKTLVKVNFISRRDLWEENHRGPRSLWHQIKQVSSVQPSLASVQPNLLPNEHILLPNKLGSDCYNYGWTQ